MKYCPKCKVTLPLAAFTVSAKRYDGVQSACADCMKEYRKAHYQNNKQAYRDRAKAKTNEMRELLRELKESQPCTDCGKSYRYWVMDFDHLDADTKSKNVAQLITHGSWARIEQEIAKCELVCANCHRERTHRRRSEHGEG